MTFGIDVSHYQGTVDWRAAAGDGVEFAFAKASEGTSGTDSRIRANLAGMRAAGIVPGAYHFLRPGGGAAQADHFAAAIGGDADGLLVALDVEVSGISWATVKAWRDRFERLFPGHPVFVYTGRDLWGRVTGDPADGGGTLGPLWAAGRAPNAYGDSGGFGLARSWATWRTSVVQPPFAGWTRPLIVQWTENVRVKGVPTPCDGDHTDLTAEELTTYTRGPQDMPLTTAEIDAVAKAAAAAVHSQQIYRETDPDGTPLTIAEALLRTYKRPALSADELAPAIAAAVVAALPGLATVAPGVTVGDVQTAAEAAVRSVLGSLG